MKDYILPLNSPESTLAVAGGKGVNLTKLLRTNFPVPSGFIITTAAYRTFMEANALDVQIKEYSGLTQTDDPATLENTSQAIRDLFYKASIPEKLKHDITDEYQQLTELVLNHESRNRSSNIFPSQTQDIPLVPVAVRSSATAEDLPGTSFAGLLDTYLNVQGEEALLEVVKRCWSSLWTARAMSYRRHHGIDSAGISQAVVIQQMVWADKSGILFTANPMSGNNKEMVINAVWGLGESVVGGKVTPDTVIVEKATGKVNHIEIANKEMKTVPVDSGTADIPVEPHQRQQAVLTTEDIAELTRIGSLIETYFNTPQDVEWAIVDRQVYILQSRSITAMLQKKEVPGGQPISSGEIPGDDDWPVLGEWSVQPFDRWTRANVGELWDNAVSPLVASTIPMIMSAAAGQAFQGVNPNILDQVQWAKRFYGRIYFNEGALRYLLSRELGLPASIIDRTRGNLNASTQYIEEKLNIFKILRHLPVLWRIIKRQWSKSKEIDFFIPKIDRMVADFLKRSSFEESDRELWDELMSWVELLKYGLKLQMDMAGFSTTSVALLEKMMMRWFGRRDLVLDLITSLPGIQAAEIGAGLRKMAQRINDLGLAGVILDNNSKTALDLLRRNGKAESVIKMLDSFLMEHGHRCPYEAEWLNPRWSDAPEQVIELIAGYIRNSDHLGHDESIGTQRREKTKTWIDSQLGLFRRWIFNILLNRSQRAIRQRDNGKSHAIKASYPARCIAVQIGQRWKKRGWLERPEDIFFLTVPDVEKIIDSDDPAAAGFDLHKLVVERRDIYEYWLKKEAPDNIGPDGLPIVMQPGKNSAENTLQGIAVSSGHVQGTVRIIRDPQKALKLQSDEILVTRATDAGWSAVFPLIAGLVTEIGGILSHAAILAREYYLPAIVNVNDATRRLKDGQRITIDCTKGCIYIDDV